MRFLEIAGANLTLAESQDEYETIKVRKGVTYVQHGSLLVPQDCLTLQLQPDPQELEQLAQGGSLYLNILGTRWPPVGITTFDPAVLNPSDGSA